VTTIVVSSGTTTVSTVIGLSTNCIVEGSGTLDVGFGGAVFGGITINGGRNVSVTSGGEVLGTVISGGGTEFVGTGGNDFGALINGAGQGVLGRARAATVFTGSHAARSSSNRLTNFGEKHLKRAVRRRASATSTARPLVVTQAKPAVFPFGTAAAKCSSSYR
jgi:hypothetical protein